MMFSRFLALIRMMSKRILFFLLLSFFSQHLFGQIIQGRHHFFNKTHKARVVVNKKYNLISDSGYFSYEFMTGNINAWTGDVYNQYPSLQFLCAYDNNKNVETGIFLCLPYTAFNGINPAGADVFFSYKLRKDLYVIFDVYTFMGYHPDLVNELGYNSGVYNLYTLRVQKDIGDRLSLYTGYSVLNDPGNLQQSLFAEVDYDLTRHVPVVLGYASDTDIGDLNVNNVYAGFGIKSDLINKSGFKLKLLTTINPLYFEHLNTNWPLTLLFSTDF